MRRKTLRSWPGTSPAVLPALILGAIVLILGAWPWPGNAQAPPAAATPAEVSPASPQALPRLLTEEADALRQRIKEQESLVTETGEQLARTRTELDNLQVAVASLQAVLAVRKPALAEVQQYLATYGQMEDGAKSGAQELAQKIEDLRGQRDAGLRAQTTLRMQVDLLQAREPVARTPEFQQAYLGYLQLADTQDRLLVQALSNLEQRRQMLEKEKELLAGVLPPLHKLEEAWKAELLKRPAQPSSLREQAARVIASLAALPGRAGQYAAALLAEGRLGFFLRTHLTHLVGLLGVVALLAWSTRRLARLVAQRFQAWRVRAEDLDLLPLYLLGQTLAAQLFLLGLILWVGLFFWTFGGLGSPLAQLSLSLLVFWWLLRLGRQWIRLFFAGEQAGGLLAVDRSTARFYRRSLQLFLAYLLLGLVGLHNAQLLGFPETSRMFLEHVFLVGILAWVLWLLRRSRLSRLLPALRDPAWLRRPGVVLVFHGGVALSLVIIVLAELLGFQNLAVYLARGAAWTLLVLALVWFLWLAGTTLIYHLLHPDTGWTRKRFPEKDELRQRLFNFVRWTLSLVLGAAAVFWTLNSWGIKPAQTAWAFGWLTWGPALGPVKLTILNVAAAVLVFYLGLWLSRLLRGLMAVKIFPHTGLDRGVQYTIATTVHYVVLVLASLTALNILGFPLTNLVLVAGALGVGIGFGLQNIVNNFLSGLILLFERPIKVGDLLVIDGQWGTVKEIRVRSTVFETVDRSVLIIPNSELISGKVLNWTHYGRGVNRLTLKVGVGYDSDVRQVTRLLTEICRANSRAVEEPPPQINFTAYGDSSLDFTIWVYVKTPSDRNPATHELNSAIFETFRDHGIEIPFPQRDLHIKQAPEEPVRKED